MGESYTNLNNFNKFSKFGWWESLKNISRRVR
jgi:hypothetical protein